MSLRRARRIALVRTILVLVPLSVLSVLASLRYHGGLTAAAQAQSQTPPAVGSLLARPVPRMQLVDERGRHVALTTWRGKWVVLASSMTLCHEVCPLTTGALISLQGQLRRAGLADRVVIAEVTVDPWRDTPTRLRAYRRLTGADFTLLTGSRAQIRRFWRFFGVYYRRVPPAQPSDTDWMTHKPEHFDVQHTDGLFLLDPAGRERMADEGMADDGGRLSAVLRSLLSAQGRRDLARPQTPWTPAEVLDDLEQLMGRAAALGPVPELDPPSLGAARRLLAGSPRALAELHARADQLLGSERSLAARIRALRGYPIVLNAWASWCGPCASEFPIFAAASARYGRRVAFLAVDTNDAAASGRAFLAQHPISYPSYQSSSAQLASLGVVEGLPTTIFIDPAGRVVDVHIGQYVASGVLGADVDRYALGRG